MMTRAGMSVRRRRGWARGGGLWRGWDGAVAEEGGMEQMLLGGGGVGGVDVMRSVVCPDMPF